MFSKLRPNHKRSGSTPSSPTPHSILTSGFLQPPSSSHGPSSATSVGSIGSAESPSPGAVFFSKREDGVNTGLQQRDYYASPAVVESPVSPLPPSLPPIPRIASVYGNIPVGVQNAAQGQEHGHELRKEKSPVWQQQDNNGIHDQNYEGEGRAVQGPQFTIQENRLHYDIPEESITHVVSRPHTSGGPSTRDWRENQSAFQLATQDIQTRERKSSYQRTQQIISQAARRPLEASSPPMVPPKDRFPYLRQNSMLVGGLKAQAVIPPLPFTQDEDEDSSRPGHPYHQYDVGSLPPVPSPNDAHSVISRNSPLHLGNQQVSRQTSNQNAQQAPARQGKNMFHLLNPMSLLSRRRNGQELEHLSEESLISSTRTPSVSPLPEGYDPSIRGKVVHDFSAPRRNFSNQSVATLGDMSGPHDLSLREGHESGQPRKESDDSLYGRQERQSQHTPVFKEHFDDDPDERRNTNASAIHAESLANKDFLARNSFPPPEHETVVPSLLPPFARTAKTIYKPLPADPPLSPSQLQSSQPTLAPPVQPQETYFGISASSGPLSPLMEDPVSPVSEARDNEANTTINTNATARNMSMRKPPTSRSRVGSRASFGSRSSIGSDFQTAGLPTHMHSRASRFSFQYANTDSAVQEKIMEERHREKAAAKALANQNRQAEEDQSEEEEDEMDYDDMDYNDMDDDVPMVGEDWDYGSGLTGGIGNLTLHSMPVTGMQGLSGLDVQEAANLALRGNPIDDGEFDGFDDEEEDEMQHQGLGGMSFGDMPSAERKSEGLGNMTLDDMPASEVQHPGLSGMSFDDMPTGEVPGLGILPAFQEDEPDVISPLEEEEVRVAPCGDHDEPQKAAVQDDNFYFDDGEFDDADFADTNTQKFDESVLDDPSHPLYERAPIGAPPPIPAKSLRRIVPQNSQKLPRQRDSLPTEPVPALPDLNPEHPDPNSSLETISKYQSALAMAATKALADGRFARDDATDDSASDISSPPNEIHDGDEENVSSRPSLIPDDGRFSQATTMSPPTVRASEIPDVIDETPSKSVGFLFPGAYSQDTYSSDFDYSDYDSAMEDDAFIAAANAEALENDDEGVYGTEFGFYARPGSTNAASDTDGDAVYGGYFGPKNWGEIKRQRSTREPNLTPITERSEYSTRNSYISLHHGDRNAASSPSLNALAQMSPGWEGDINMETLMKLRRGAFGGSQRSNTSSRGEVSSPMNSSPVVPKGDPRVLWSSVIRQELPRSNQSNSDETGGDGFYEDYLDGVNCQHDEVDHEAPEYENEWADASDEDSEAASGHEEEGQDDSPTIRADAHGFAVGAPSLVGSDKDFPSPVSEDFGRPTHQDLPKAMTPTSPSSASTSSTIQKVQPDTAHAPVFTSRPNSLGLISPTSPTSAAQQKGHSRNGSDSVAYVREQDQEGGPFRWFLERRRTGEDGVEALVGRTLVEGGRI
ncbi:hypothetical protein FKW77_003917 [Venturia effusa]|uniref:AGC-kinase C-terminal domain-containing protein n=1 Tax=Venturia effusa TaxID=50376 RepID=A0A517LGZ2_9PEZI|nr:hypothetical protein FKW77_003917 [Venturia effusa]